MPQTRAALALAALTAATGIACAQPAGPDLVVGEVDAVMRWGTRDGLVAYSVGSVVCNEGDGIADWYRQTPAHPVIAGDLFRLKDGRFEQIGVSWVKHTFFADIASLCRTCQIPAGYNGTQLGVGCSDAYSASINGEVWTQGPRSQINGFTGVFVYPADLTGYPAATPTIGRRLQVPQADVDPAQNAGARYFASSTFIAADEAAFGNGENSTGYREFTVAAGTFNWSPAPASATRRGIAALYAWQEADPTVRIERAQIPGEGVLLLASKAEPAAGGGWRYLYAVQNLNSDLAVGGVRLPLSACAGPAQTACILPRYHSGEPWSNAPWPFTQGGGWAGWTTPEPYATNPNSSAVRWATVATYELITDRPPRSGTVELSLFKTGGPISVGAVVPGGTADFNGDGFLDFFDYDDFVGAFEIGEPGADFNGDGFLDFFDYDDFVGAFESGC